MSYAVKEIFYTLQGEGMNAGRPAVFLRFSGCNLWNGREDGRMKGRGGCARWCDTDFLGVDGHGGGHFDSAEALAEAVAVEWPRNTDASKFVVCTGGEPLLQLDDALVEALHKQGFSVAVETNGTVPAPQGIDWLCVSPKAGAPLAIETGDELKLVFPQEQLKPTDFEGLSFQHFLLQPKDGHELQSSTQLAVDYCLANPRWKLSIQTHKILGIR